MTSSASNALIMSSESAEQYAAELNADPDDEWSYVVLYMVNTDRARIKILDEAGELVGYF